MPPPTAHELLAAQLRRAWTNARWVLDDLTDEEHRWEPTSPCWSVRPRSSGATGWGAGAWCCEDRWPPPDPLPVTTIAWRLAHLAGWTEVYLDWTFGSATLALDQVEVRGEADASVAWLVDVQDRFLAEVDALDDGSAFALRPAHWGEQLPVAHLVSIELTEHVHHLAEIGTLRDLWRGAAVNPPLPARPSAPAWWDPSAGS